MTQPPTVLFDGRTALTGGGQTVLHAIEQHLIPHLSDYTTVVRRPGNYRRVGRLSPVVPLTLPGRQPDVVVGLSEAANFGAGGSKATIMLARNWNCWAPEVTIRRKIRSRVARRNARRADIIVTATHVFGEALRAQIAGPKRFEVLPFGVNTAFTPDGPRTDGRYFLTVGDWYPWKNFEVAVEAFAYVANDLPDTNLRIAGREIHPDYVARTLGLADELGISDRIEVLGPVGQPDLASLYRGAIATIITSELETFGHPYLETMASGTPLIGRSMNVTEELVGDHGVLLVGGASEFAAAMRDAAGGPDERVVEEALAHVTQFSWQRFADGLRELIVEGMR